MYCEKCEIVFYGLYCPVCGNRKLREPTADDLCFLVEKEEIWSGMLADVLKQNNIPFLTKESMGTGMALKIGPLLESFQFYVPYSRLEEAKELVNELFAGEPIEEEKPEE